jgi:hypothetical protein
MRTVICTAVVLLVVSPMSHVYCQGSEVYYSIKEELSPGTIFGYIVDDSDLRRKVSVRRRREWMGGYW